MTQQVIEKLDPGFTLQRGSVLKKIACVRIELAQRHLQLQGDSYRIQNEKELFLASEELKSASFCMGLRQKIKD